MSILLQAVDLVSDPFGSLLYHLVLVFAMGLAAAIVLPRGRRGPDAVGARLAIAVAGIFLLRLLNLILALLAAFLVDPAAALPVDLDPLVAIPPFDRAASALTIVITIWAFAFPHPQRLADAAWVGLSAVILLALGFSWDLWAQVLEADPTAAYNGSGQETAWEAAKIGLLVGGLILLAVRRRADWRIGMALLAVLLVGHIVHYFYPLAGESVPGAERLAEILAAPMLVAMMYRRAQEWVSKPEAAPPAVPAPQASESPEATLSAAPPPVAELEVVATASYLPETAPAPVQTMDLRTVAALASLNASASQEELARAITRAVAHTLQVDVCLLLEPPDETGTAGVSSGYDRAQEKFLTAGFALLTHTPEITSALNEGATLRLAPGQHDAVILNLARSVGIEQIGPALIAPLRKAGVETEPASEDGGALLGAIVLLSPYTRQDWSPADQALLQALAEPIAATICSAQSFARLKQELEHQQVQVGEARADAECQRQEAEALAGQLQTLREVREQQAKELDEVRTQLQAAQREVDERQRVEAELDTALKRLDVLARWEERLKAATREVEQGRQREMELRQELERVREELKNAAGRSLPTSPPTDDGHEGLGVVLAALNSAQDKLAVQNAALETLRKALAEKERLLAQRSAPGKAVQAADAEVIASLTQELRQPMSSIVGYADLLLGESVGIVGALQRKFLERIKASSERMGVLLDDLIRVMDIDSGNLQLAQESVDVTQVIDDVVRSCSALFREKDLHLVREIPPALPPVQADHDALLQIFTHLLNNTGRASANDTEVSLRVQRETEQRWGSDPVDYLIFSVSDTGGGIAPEDQPRVFSRLYRADAPLIAGLGDNGMGLSIAKALVEAHGGRIWVISDPGIGSTFYVLLPVNGKHAAPSDGPRPDHD